MRRSLLATLTLLALLGLSDATAHAITATQPQEISGYVRDENNRAIRNMCVTIESSPPQTAKTFTDGSYLLINVPVGSYPAYAWDCTAAARNAPTTFQDVPGIALNTPPAFFVVSLPDAPNVEVNYRLVKGGGITVKAVGADGKGINGATVCPFFDTLVSGNLVASGVCEIADRNGIARLTGIYPGHTRLRISSSGRPDFWYYAADFNNATRVQVLANRTIALGNVDVDTDMSGTGTITGRITGAGNVVLAKACATVWMESGTLDALASPTDGTYTINNVPAGFWEVTGHDCNDTALVKYAPTVYKNHQGSLDAETSDRVLVENGATTSGINMILAKSGAIRVRVVDATNGNPIPGATACPIASVANKYGHSYQSGFCTTADSNGDVFLTGVDVGANKSFAFASGYNFTWFGGTDFASADRITVRVGMTTNITIQMTPSP